MPLPHAHSWLSREQRGPQEVDLKAETQTSSKEKGTRGGRLLHTCRHTWKPLHGGRRPLTLCAVSHGDWPMSPGPAMSESCLRSHHGTPAESLPPRCWPEPHAAGPPLHPSLTSAWIGRKRCIAIKGASLGAALLLLWPCGEASCRDAWPSRSLRRAATFVGVAIILEANNEINNGL